MKEDLECKRKCSQKDEETEKEMLSEAKKCIYAYSIESMSNALTNYMQMMQHMMQAQ